MADARPPLPELAVNRSFMSAFLAEDPPCLALGMVEEGENRCALLALRLDRAPPQQVSAGGFSFGHALFGGGTCGRDSRAPGRGRRTGLGIIFSTISGVAPGARPCL